MTRKVALLAGIDVSARHLQVALRGKDGTVRDLVFTNDAAGHRKLVGVLTAGRLQARAVVEATSTFALDLCLALHQAEVAIMVVNPKAARRFAEAHLRRAKTDRVDARALLDFLERMEFVPWRPPTPNRLAVSMIARRMCSCIDQRVAEQARLLAARATAQTPTAILLDVQQAIESLDARAKAMEREALGILRSDPELAPVLDAVLSVPGIAERTAVRLLGELLLLPDDLTTRQVVAHAGLDPRPRESGASAPPRVISRVGNARLRHALYMPALSALQCDPHVAHYFQTLVGRGKPRMVAVVAVMRKLLHATWTLARTQDRWDGARFRLLPVKTASVA